MPVPQVITLTCVFLDNWIFCPKLKWTVENTKSSSAIFLKNDVCIRLLLKGIKGDFVLKKTPFRFHRLNLSYKDTQRKKNGAQSFSVKERVVIETGSCNVEGN